MGDSKRILVVREQPKEGRVYLIDGLIPHWERMGYSVVNRRSREGLPDADLVVLHVDQTVVAPDVARRLEDYPVVLNGNALDISKSRFSEIRLGPDADFQGPVIVKTDANFGGYPEAAAQKAAASSPARLWTGARRRLERSRVRWEGVTRLDSRRYPVFGSVQDVPEGVWRNPHLIVEKFLPEQEGDRYFLRHWNFFGTQEFTKRFASRSPCVKFNDRVSEVTEVGVPEKLRRIRKALGMDFGRFDFVEVDGEAVLFDANKTVGVPRSALTAPEYAHWFRILAEGVKDDLRE